MKSSAGETLENQLMEAGKKLLKPPSPVEELLPLLDQVEMYLSKVEQSPNVTMHNALSPSMKALVANELLRHYDMDIKVAVASCISEITRITAPEAPYDDDQMKEIFQLIVVAFEKLHDISSRSYSKRVSILETVAKVRSCVVMLDLECDALILEMFQHFLKSIRDNHPENVFSSMETIMKLVLEESEEVSPELLSPLLNSVRKDNQDVLPIAKKLADKVLENCAAKLRPYLMQAVKSLGSSMQDYSKVVAVICREACDNVKHGDGSAFDELLVDQKKTPERLGSDKEPETDQERIEETVGSDEATQGADEQKLKVASPRAVDPIVEKSEKAVVNNGTETGKSNSLISSDSLEKKEVSDSSIPLAEVEKAVVSNGTETGKSNSVISSDSLEKKEVSDSLEKKEVSDSSIPLAEVETNINSSTIVHSETNPEPIGKESEDQKPDSSIPSADASDISQTVSEKEAGGHVSEKKNHSEEASSPPSKDCCMGEAATPPENEKETRVTSPTMLENDTVNVASLSPSQSLLEQPYPKREGRRSNKRDSNEDSELDSSSVPKGASSNNKDEDEAPPSADVISKTENKEKKDSEATQQEDSKDGETPSADVTSPKVTKVEKDSEAKQNVHSHRKTKAIEEKSSHPVDAILMKESGPGSDSEAKLVIQSSKKVDDRTSKKDELSLDKQEVRAKKGREKNNSKKVVTGEPNKKVDERNSKEDELPLDNQESKAKKGRDKVNFKKEATGEVSKENVCSPTTAKSSNKDQSHLDETPHTKPKRKRTPGKEVASETPNSVKTGAELVGEKIKVWWPLDKKFYEGTVDSFDSVKMKHKIVYVDGEIEILNLERQRWEFVKEDAAPETEQATEPSSPGSDEMPQKKKGKTDSSASRAKKSTSSKRRKRGSASRSKGSATKSGGNKSKENRSKSADKSKDEGSSKSKDGPPKSSSKLKKEESQNPGSKSRDESSSKAKEEKDGESKDATTKTSSKQKENLPNSGGKVKVMAKDDDATPLKSGSKGKGEAGNTSNSKSSANGTSSAKKGKSGSSSKVQEGSSKGKSAKAEESETKRGKKNKASGSETRSGRKRPRKANS